MKIRKYSEQKRIKIKLDPKRGANPTKKGKTPDNT